MFPGPCVDALGHKGGIADPDNPGAENMPDTPDEILKKYGVLEENSTASPIALFNTFLTQAKADSVTLYKDLFEEVKALCQETNQVVPENNREKEKEDELVAGVNKEKVLINDMKEEKKIDENKLKPTKGKNFIKIMAEYLCEMARKVSDKCFMTLIIFTRLYKDYMNIHGWSIIGKYKQVTAEETNKAYTTYNDAEHVPEASNDFTKNYLPKEYPNFDQGVSVDVTFHLCGWLFRKEYTHTHITFI